jgi:methyl coenzyme M reductase subunit D
MSPSLFVNFSYHGVGGEKFPMHQTFYHGLFMAKLKEITRASSYGNRGLKVLPRLLLLIEENVKLMRRLGAIATTLKEDSARVVQL